MTSSNVNFNVSCPIPNQDLGVIKLGHGSGRQDDRSTHRAGVHADFD